MKKNSGGRIASLNLMSVDKLLNRRSLGYELRLLTKLIDENPAGTPGYP